MLKRTAKTGVMVHAQALDGERINGEAAPSTVPPSQCIKRAVIPVTAPSMSR